MSASMASVTPIFPGAMSRPRVTPIRMSTRLRVAKGAIDFTRRLEAKIRSEVEARLVREYEEGVETRRVAQEEARALGWDLKVDEEVYAVMLRRRHRGPMRKEKARPANGGLTPAEIAWLDAKLAQCENAAGSSGGPA